MRSALGAANAWRARRPRLAMSIGWGLAVSLIFLAALLPEYLDTRSLQIEEAVVTRVDFGPGTTNCGKGSTSVPKQMTTYRIESPRPGFPAQFIGTGCPDGSSVGQVVNVTRDGPAVSPSVHVDPVNSLGQLLGAWAFGFAVGSSVVYIGLRIEGVLRGDPRRR